MGKWGQPAALHAWKDTFNKTESGLLLIFTEGESCEELREHRAGSGWIVEMFQNVLFCFFAALLNQPGGRVSVCLLQEHVREFFNHLNENWQEVRLWAQCGS